MSIYNKYFNNIRGCIIPHSGIEYGGAARKIIFENINNNDEIKYIIYLAALHNPSNSNEKVYVLENNEIFKEYFTNKSNYIIDNKLLSEGAKNEHSYKLVESELKEYFKNAKILVLCPTPYSNLNNLGNDIINYINIKKIIYYYLQQPI